LGIYRAPYTASSKDDARDVEQGRLGGENGKNVARVNAKETEHYDDSASEPLLSKAAVEITAEVPEEGSKHLESKETNNSCAASEAIVNPAEKKVDKGNGVDNDEVDTAASAAVVTGQEGKVEEGNWVDDKSRDTINDSTAASVQKGRYAGVPVIDTLSVTGHKVVEERGRTASKMEGEEETGADGNEHDKNTARMQTPRNWDEKGIKKVQGQEPKANVNLLISLPVASEDKAQTVADSLGRNTDGHTPKANPTEDDSSNAELRGKRDEEKLKPNTTQAKVHAEKSTPLSNASANTVSRVSEAQTQNDNPHVPKGRNPTAPDSNMADKGKIAHASQNLAAAAVSHTDAFSTNGAGRKISLSFPGAQLKTHSGAYNVAQKKTEPISITNVRDFSPCGDSDSVASAGLNAKQKSSQQRQSEKRHEIFPRNRDDTKSGKNTARVTGAGLDTSCNDEKPGLRKDGRTRSRSPNQLMAMKNTTEEQETSGSSSPTSKANPPSPSKSPSENQSTSSEGHRELTSSRKAKDDSNQPEDHPETPKGSVENVKELPSVDKTQEDHGAFQQSSTDQLQPQERASEGICGNTSQADNKESPDSAFANASATTRVTTNMLKSTTAPSDSLLSPTSTSDSLQLPTAPSNPLQSPAATSASPLQPVTTTSASPLQPVTTTSASPLQPVTTTSDPLQPVTTTSDPLQPVTTTSDPLQPVTTTSDPLQSLTVTSTSTQQSPTATSASTQQSPTATSASPLQPVTTTSASPLQPVPETSGPLPSTTNTLTSSQSVTTASGPQDSASDPKSSSIGGNSNDEKGGNDTVLNQNPCSQSSSQPEGSDGKSSPTANDNDETDNDKQDDDGSDDDNFESADEELESAALVDSSKNERELHTSVHQPVDPEDSKVKEEPSSRLKKAKLE
jgi:hypothetical protein